jgi:hypothetical protein
LVEEIEGIRNADDLAVWTHGRFAAKNTLTAKDAEAIELAYVRRLKASDNGLDGSSDPGGGSSDFPPTQPKSGERTTALDTNYPKREIKDLRLSKR